MKKCIKVGIIFLIFAFIAGCGKTTTLPKVDDEPDKKEEIVEKKVQIVDVNSNTRPIAVMINNHNDARTVQSSLQKAYIVYEIIVEGGITRYLALYKDVDEATIGSVRSSRHYYLDYVLENDAIYVHWGYSTQAKEDIATLGINNINGLVYEGSYFYRINNNAIAYEHRGFTTIDLLNKAIEKMKYRTTTDKGLLLQYSAEPVELNEASDAKNITIKYSNYITDEYKYDENSKSYLRRVNGSNHVDHETEKDIMVKNIIIYQLKNSTRVQDIKGRQDLDNIGSGSGYYVSEGKAVEINWTKKSRESKTTYTLKDSSPLVVNDGNTFIQIVPETGNITVE